MIDLRINASWKNWSEEKPEEGDYFYAIGKYHGCNEYCLLANQSYPMLTFHCDIAYGLDESGNLTMVGFHKPHVIFCFGMDRFEGNNEFDIEYWINVNDLLPNFLKK